MHDESGYQEWPREWQPADLKPDGVPELDWSSGKLRESLDKIRAQGRGLPAAPVGHATGHRPLRKIERSFNTVVRVSLQCQDLAQANGMVAPT